MIPPKKTRDLDITPYKPDLRVIVSDPALDSLDDADPLKKSKRVDLKDIAASAKVWDITPTLDISVGNPTVTDSVNCIVDTELGTIGLDVTNAPPFTGQNAAYHVGAAKTNVTLSSLVDGTGSFISFDTVVLNASNSVGIMGMLVCSNKDVTAENAALFMQELLINNTPRLDIVDDYILVMSGDYGGPKVVGGFIGVHDDVNQSTPLNFTMDNAPTNTPLVGVGKKTTIVLNRETGTLSVGSVISSGDGQTYDVIAANKLNDNPNFPADSIVFYVFVGLNFGFGMPGLVMKPITEVGRTTYQVAGTSANTLHGLTQLEWDDFFPHELTPLTNITVTHAVFPEYVFNGCVLLTYLDPLYTHYTLPAPYGIQVTGGSLCVVTDVAFGGETFIPQASNQELLNLGVTVLSHNSRLNALTAQVSAAAKLVDLSEVIVYATNPQITASTLPGTSVYATFDEAYDYLLTLPGFIKKRIVLDDRAAIYYEGTTNFDLFTTRKYMLMSNNITLSTLKAFTDGNATGPNITLSMHCDGLRLIDFEGALQPVGLGNGFTKEVVDLAETIAPAYGARFNDDNFVIGSNTMVTSNSDSVRDIDGGSIVLLDNAVYDAFYTLPFGAQFNNSVVITKSQESKLRIYGTIPEYEINGNKSIRIVTSRTEFPTYLSVSEPSPVELIYLDPFANFRLRYPNFITLDSTAAILANSNYDQNGWNLLNGNYIVVGEIDVSNNPSIILGGEIFLLGVANARIISNGNIFETFLPDYDRNSYARIKLRNIDFKSSVQALYALHMSGDISMVNCTINAVYPMSMHGAKLVLNDVRLEREGNGDVVSTSLITSDEVIVDGIRADLSTTSPLLSYGLVTANKLTVSNALINYYNGVNPGIGLIDIGQSALTIGTLVSTSNISFVGVEAPLFMVSGALVASPEQHVKIKSDTFKRYVRFVTDVLKCGVNGSYERILVPITGSESSGFSATAGAYDFVYNGNEYKQFEFSAIISYTYPGAISGTNFYTQWNLRKNNTVIKTGFSTLNTVTGVDEAIRVSTIVWLAPGDVLSLGGFTSSFSAGSPITLPRGNAFVSITQL